MPSPIYIRSENYRKGVASNDKAVKAYFKYCKLYKPVEESAMLYQLQAIHLKAAYAMMAASYRDAITASNDLRRLTTDTFLRSPAATGNSGQYIYSFRLLSFLRFGKWNLILQEPMADTLLHYAYVPDHFVRGRYSFIYFV